MTREQILKLWPNASESTIRANLSAGDSGLCATTAKPVERLPLEGVGKPEDQNWYAAFACFEITFTVYSVRPADYDGYCIKALQDFCVKIGIIPEDRWDVIVGGTVRSRKVATEGEERTEVEFKACKNPEATAIEVFSGEC